MSSENPCRLVAELAPELALGIATGEERARSFEHLAECASCRKLLDELSGLGDDMLLLAPPHEPPIGFETRVLERIHASHSSPRRRSRARVTAALVAAAVLVAAAAAGTVLRLTGPDRELASSYRRTLAVANGDYFAAEPLYGHGREISGHVFGYQGKPSWIFVVVSDADLSGRFDIRVETQQGRHIVGAVQVQDGNGSWGRVVPVELHDIDEVTLSRAGSDETYEADF